MFQLGTKIQELTVLFLDSVALRLFSNFASIILQMMLKIHIMADKLYRSYKKLTIISDLLFKIY